MKTRRRAADGVATTFALALVALSGSVAAQTVPPAAPPPAAPAAPPPTAPAPATPPASPAPVDPAAPAPSSPPPADPAAPPPAAPPPAEPAPMAASPLVAGDAQTQSNTEFTPPPPPPEAPPEEQEDRTRDAFSRGTLRLSVLVGSGSIITENYLILGAGVGYFVLDGLGVGLDYKAWIFASPVMHRLSPEVKYVFHMVPIIKPYVGTFYRHTFVTGDYEDYEHVGGRGGLFYAPPRSRVYVGGGAVYEHLLDCTDSAFIDCDDVYPEILIGISI